MKRLFGVLILFLGAASSFANSNALLDQKGADDLDLSNKLNTQKTLKLDDPFLVQLYSNWKARGPLSHETNNWISSIVEHRFKDALKNLPKINDSKIRDLQNASELYLLFRLGLFQTFLGEWIEYSASSDFLGTELALALDQIVGSQATNIYVSSGFFLTDKMSAELSKIEEAESRINYSLQAFKAIGSGDKAVKWIGKLNPEDNLRVHLAYSAALSYAKKGKLGSSGTLIKKIIEPWVETRASHEEVAFYYLNLGRLLYQARAFDQSISYFELIPESSSYFLQARTEILWAYLQTRNFSRSSGELASLKMSVFSRQFYPEIFLASAIGHTMLCQFTDAKNSIRDFISSNKEWGKKIEKALRSKNPELINENFQTIRVRKQITSMNRERLTLKNYKIVDYDQKLEKRINQAKSWRQEIAYRGWNNRYKIFDSALYKMKFVRIELLSRMKAVHDGLQSKLAHQDEVKLYQAATAKSNQLHFPSDGMPWGDELFNMSADVVNECIQGKFYAK